jgi:hypothetical protein
MVINFQKKVLHAPVVLYCTVELCIPPLTGCEQIQQIRWVFCELRQKQTRRTLLQWSRTARKFTSRIRWLLLYPYIDIATAESEGSIETLCIGTSSVKLHPYNLALWDVSNVTIQSLHSSKFTFPKKIFNRTVSYSLALLSNWTFISSQPSRIHSPSYTRRHVQDHEIPCYVIPRILHPLRPP